MARLHARIADCCTDALHKSTRKLVNENQVVCVESLSGKNMLRNPSLSGAIAGASWNELLCQRQYKDEWAGQTLSLLPLTQIR